LKNNEVKLIEFSPFLRCTSACLFRWDLNYEEMLHGDGKLTVRDKVSPQLEYFVNDWETAQSKPSDPFDNYFIEDDEDEDDEEDNKDNFIDKAKHFFSYLNPMRLFNKKKDNENNNKIEEKKRREKNRKNRRKNRRKKGRTKN